MEFTGSCYIYRCGLRWGENTGLNRPRAEAEAGKVLNAEQQLSCPHGVGTELLS